MGVPPPRSSERRSGVGPKLASLDHLDKPGGELSVLAAEHIPEVMQLAPPPLDLVDHIAHRERAHKYCEVIRPPFRHSSSPVLGSAANLARFVVQHDLDRAEEPLSAKLRANHRLEIRSLAVYVLKARKRL